MGALAAVHRTVLLQRYCGADALDVAVRGLPIQVSVTQLNIRELPLFVPHSFTSGAHWLKVRADLGAEGREEFLIPQEI
jgi:hypothetical protein